MPPTPCDLIITRHGETEWNLAGRHQGHLDSPLTPLGRAQAEAFALALREVPIAAFYSSDLGRAMETAQIIAGVLRLDPIVPVPGLREMRTGLNQGLTLAEFKAAHPELFQAQNRRDPDFRLPGGESLREFSNRTVAALEEIAAGHPGQTVLVVTHGGNLSCLFRWIFSLPHEQQRRFSLKNVSFNRFTVSEGVWWLDAWGETSHLRKLTALDEL